MFYVSASFAYFACLIWSVMHFTWCVLSYFGNFRCVDASHSETIEVELPHLFLMHHFYSISLWWLFFSPGTCSIDAVPDYSASISSMSSASVLSPHFAPFRRTLLFYFVCLDINDIQAKIPISIEIQKECHYIVKVVKEAIENHST